MKCAAIAGSGSIKCAASPVVGKRWVNKFCSNCCGLVEVGQQMVQQLLWIREGG